MAALVQRQILAPEFQNEDVFLRLKKEYSALCFILRDERQKKDPTLTSSAFRDRSSLTAAPGALLYPSSNP